MQLFVYPWDIVDAGIGETVAAIRSWGFASAAVAVNYHTAKLLLPHNPKRKVYFPEAGRFYMPLAGEFAKSHPIRPLASAWAKQHSDFWERLGEACAKYGLKVTAWTIGAHNTTLGYMYPQFVCRNAFGDPYYFALCPSRPEVRDYLVGTVRHVSEHPVISSLFLESFQFMDFEHGYHHEMTGVDASKRCKRLLSYCFCAACMEGGAARGIEMEAARRAVVREIERELAREPGLQQDAAAGQDAMAELTAQLDAYRQAVVLSLVADIRAASRKPLAYFTKPPGECEANGVCAEDLARHVDWLESYAYEPGTAVIDRVVAQFSAIGNRRLRLALRAGFPDVVSPAQLVERVRHARSLGLAGVSLYNFGQVPLSHWKQLAAIKNGG